MIKNRPEWCPHIDCLYLQQMQDATCVGKLPTPEPHGDISNTHRFCLHGAKDDGEWTFDLQIHSGDAYFMSRLLKIVMDDKS